MIVSEYYTFDFPEVDTNDGRLKCSNQMIKALNNAEDCNVVSSYLRVSDEKRYEYVVCDICCDEIPSKNMFGINYRERIAFVFGNSIKVPKTLALRKDFPATMHQNLSPSGFPKDLCLYEESEDVTLISWTPERHIRRLKWWLVQAAKGKLHSEEQAVEQFLFNPTATIVIPYDYRVGLKQGKRLAASLIQDSDKLFIEAQWNINHHVSGVKINLINIETNDVTHGSIRQAPQDLKDFVGLMNAVGVDFLDLLRQRLYNFTKEEGDLNAPITALIVTIPIRRSNNGSAEREQTIGFWFNNSVLHLLKVLEVVVTENGLPNLTLQGSLHPMTSDIPDIEMLPMEVLSTVESSARRAQSGYNFNIGHGLLIGAGALGASLLDIWVKGGWGKWTVCDNDHFRPHNFTRHVASTAVVGQNKALVAASYANFNFNDSDVCHLAKNACQFSDDEVKSVFSKAELVVDASTSLEYPRDASLKHNLPRHVSVFFSPNGNDAVLLFEDHKRNIRLNSLEAQYYRALLTTEVGNNHLTMDSITFRSGVSCRDVSVVMSFARTSALSSLLSEQIRRAIKSENASIRIWQDNQDSGERQLTEIQPFKVKSNKNHTLGGFKIFWDEGIEAKVKGLRHDALPYETGGILIGYHDMVRKCVFIVDALPAPSDSRSTHSSFTRGVEGVVESLEIIANKTANNVGYIGEWHSHPNGASANMSDLDKLQLTELSENLSYDGLPAYQMIVAKNEIKVHEKRSTRI